MPTVTCDLRAEPHWMRIPDDCPNFKLVEPRTVYLDPLFERYVKEGGEYITRVTDAELPAMSDTAKSSAPDAEQPEIAVIREFATGATCDTDEGKLELAWAAGLFEGEGCIRTDTIKGRWRRDGSRGGPYFYPRLDMSLTDEDVINRFCAAVGGRVRGPYLKEGRKPIWYWSAQNNEAIAIMQKLRSFLGERRSAKAAEVFDAEV